MAVWGGNSANWFGFRRVTPPARGLPGESLAKKGGEIAMNVHSQCPQILCHHSVNT